MTTIDRLTLSGAALLLVASGLAFAGIRMKGIPAQPAAVAASGEPCAGTTGSCAAPTGKAAARGEVALPEGKPRLLEFESAHCASCKRMAPVLKELEARCAKEADTVLRIAVDDDRGEALAARYGVRYLPTFMSVDAAGAEVERAVGEQPRERLATLLGDVRGERCPPAL